MGGNYINHVILWKGVPGRPALHKFQKKEFSCNSGRLFIERQGKYSAALHRDCKEILLKYMHTKWYKNREKKTDWIDFSSHSWKTCKQPFLFPRPPFLLVSWSAKRRELLVNNSLRDNLVLSARLIMWISHRKAIRKLTFGIQIHIISPVDKTKLSCNTPHRRSTTVSLETCSSEHFKTSSTGDWMGCKRWFSSPYPYSLLLACAAWREKLKGSEFYKECHQRKYLKNLQTWLVRFDKIVLTI